MSKRDESVFLKNPYPGDKAFEPPSAHDNLFDLPPINLEILSGKKRAPQP